MMMRKLSVSLSDVSRRLSDTMIVPGSRTEQITPT